MSENNQISGFKFLFLGLIVFLALGMDFFVIIIDNILWGDIHFEDFLNSPWYILTTHWCIVIILWLICGILIFKWLRKNIVIEDVISVKRHIDVLPFIIITVLTSILFTVLESIIYSVQLPQFYREYQCFVKSHGSMGLIILIFQNIYYFVESMIVVLLLALMQRAGELLFKKDFFPYGGIGLLFTWGIGHLSHGLISTLWICGFCLIYGLLFVKTKKYLLPSLIFIWLVFFI